MNRSRILSFGQFEVDVQANELRRQGVLIKVQDQPFRVLLALLDRPGEVVTREELRRRVWDETTFVDFDQSLSKAIGKLRDALGDEAANPRFIETLTKRGYRFIAPVHGEPTVEQAAPQRTLLRRRLVPAVALGAALLTAWATWRAIHESLG